MNSNSDFNQQLQQAIADFDQWCSENPSADLEAFLKTVDLPTSIADELRAHVSREQDLQEMLGQPVQGKPDFPKTRTEQPTDAAHSKRQRIGRYKLLQELGDGGMGTVWMAEQEDPVKRRVALKVIKAGMDTETVIARFEAERQALAIMDHPNIAKVLDAGVTEEGRPYFVMELVKGIPLNTYCDYNKLSIGERLQLFIPVCEAVQHAHQKGIIHRDLKPSNVLISLYDGQPVPKVIDFGLAKALDHQTKLTDKTLFTEFGMVVGTLQYMSPEQAEMNSLDVDTRTDIYSLGAMLYELLTGSTPIERDTIQQNAMLQILDVIRHKDPPRPSTRLSESGDAATGISEQRKINPSRLSQILRGELDWIVMKSIEKDRNRRYDSAKTFADDISRFLKDEVVVAKPPHVSYLLGKFVNRHRSLVYTAVAIFAILLVSTISLAVLWQKSVVAEREADKARRDAIQYEHGLQDSQQQLEEFFKSFISLFEQENGLFINEELTNGSGEADLDSLALTPAEARQRLKQFELQYGVMLTSLGFFLQQNGLAAKQRVKWYEEAIRIFENTQGNDQIENVLAAYGTALTNAAMDSLSNPVLAKEYINKAINVREQWHREFNSTASRNNLAGTLLNSSVVDKQTAKQRLDRMIEVLTSAPESELNKKLISEAYFNRNYSRPKEESHKDVERAIEYLEQHVQNLKKPTSDDLGKLAKYYNWYSVVLNDPEQKRLYSTKSVEMIGKQIELFPYEAFVQQEASMTFYNHGASFVPWNEDSEAKESLKWFDESIKVLERIRKRDSSVTRSPVFFLAYMSRAEAYIHLGQFKKGQDSYDVLIELLDSANPKGEYTKYENLIRTRQLRCVAESDALKAAEKLANLMQEVDLIGTDFLDKLEVLYTAAAIYSLASETELDGTESKKLVEKSVQILQGMEKQGLLKSKLNDLKKDEDFDPIRRWPGLKLLIEGPDRQGENQNG